MTRTNTPTPGSYEIPALPPGRKYGVIVSAPGYGQKQLFNLDISADAGRQELDPVELKPANLKLAGQVLDADDNPIAGCSRELNGEGQPNVSARTDHEWTVYLRSCLRRRASNLRQLPGCLWQHIRGRRRHQCRLAAGPELQFFLRRPAAQIERHGHERRRQARRRRAGGGVPQPTARAGSRPALTANTTSPGRSSRGRCRTAARTAGRSATRPAIWRRSKELSEDATNLDVKLKPALTFTGQVKNAGDAPCLAHRLGFWIKAGNSYN